MRNLFSKKVLLLIVINCCLHAVVSAQFTQGRIVVLRSGDGSGALSSAATPMYLVEYDPAAPSSPTYTLAMPTTTSGSINRITGSGSATSEGQLNLSVNGNYLTLGGYDASVGTASVNSSASNRVIMRVNAAGNLATTVFSNATHASGFRSVVTSDGSAYWTAGNASGVNYFTHSGSTTAQTATAVSTTTTNNRTVSIFNNQLYVSTGSGTQGIYAVGSGIPTTTGATGAIKITTNDPYAYIMINRGGTNWNCYLVNATTTVGILKYSSTDNGSTWTARGSITTSAVYGITAQLNGSNVDIYATTGSSIIKLTDAAAYNATISGTVSTLVNAPTNTAFRGIAFAPTTPCTAPTISSITSNSPICASNTINLQLTTTGSSITSYAWTGPNSYSSSSQSPSISNATTAATGTYSVTATNACGSTTGSVSVTVNSNPTATITASGATTFCSGDSVTLTASGGSTYLWSTSETTTSINVKTGGNYTVTATQNGCSNTSSAATVTVNSLVTPSISIASSTGNNFCNGVSKTFTATPVNGGSSPTYQWKVNGNNEGTNQSTYSTTSLLNGDVISCEMTSNATCPTSSLATSNSITVSQVNVVASATAGTITCNGGSTSVLVAGSNGTSPYSGTGSFSVTAGTYNYTVTDANGCTGTTSLTVSQPSALIASESHTTILCNGGNSTITVSATGGTSPYTNTGLFTQTAGSQNYTITDASGCTSSVTATVSQPTVLQISETHGTITTPGGSSSVTISANGGTSPYSGTGTFNQSAGTTTYTITDGNGCTASTSVILTEPSALTITETHNEISCNGGSTTVTITVSGGTAPYTGAGDFTQAAGNVLYTVTDANGVSGTLLVTLSEPAALIASVSNTSILCNGGLASVTVSATGGTQPYSGTGIFNVNAGNYNYTVTDFNGCSSTQSKVINEPALLTVSESHDSILCNGGSTVISLVASGGTSPYAGTNLNTVVAGIYDYIVTDANGCSTNKHITITQPSLLTTNETHTAILCKGASSVVTVSANGGVLPYSGTGNFNQVAGSQQYIVTDANGCTSSVIANISEPSLLIITASPTAIECTGGNSTVTISANGGVAPYIGTGSITQLAGTYTYTITDANGCTSSSSLTIADGVTPSISSFTPAVGLPGTSITITGVGFTGTTNVKVNGINANYIVNSDVQITATVPVGSGSGVIQVIKNTCSGISTSNFGITSVTELVVPKYVGSKTAASTNNSRTPVAFCFKVDNLLPSTTYSLTTQLGLTTELPTVYGAGNIWNGTAYSGSQYLNAFTTNSVGSSGPVWFYIQPTGNGTRFDAGVAHNPRVSFYTGTIAPTNAMYAFTKTITPLDIASTARTATSTDDGAYITGSLDSCMSGKIVLIYDTIAGDVSPLYAYPAVSNFASTYSSSDFTGTLAILNQVYLNTASKGSFAGVIPIGANNNSRGVRRVETRDAQNNLISYVTDADGIWPSGANTTTVLKRGLVTLNNNDASLNTISAITTSTSNILCNGGSTGVATATVISSSNSINYSWNAGVYTTASINNITAGTYSLIATDGNGCRKTATAVITSPTSISVTATAGTIACNGGSTSVIVSASGGTQPYTGTGTFNVTAGTYNYIITDANGCTASNSVTVSEPSDLSINTTLGSINCNGGSTSLSITASGGTSPYTGTGNFTLYAGPYSYLVSDAKGCTKSFTGTLTEPAVLTSSESHTAISCYGGSSTVTISAVGGVSPYSGTGDFTQTVANNSYTITDANGCTSSVTATVSIPTQLTLTETHGTIGIAGGSTTVNISANGGTPPYNGTGVITQSAGVTNYTVTDANNCSSQIAVTLTEPGQLVVSESHSPILCNGSTTDVTITVSGGVAPFTGTGVFSQSAGTTIYNVTDANGATGSLAVTLTQPTALIASESHTSISCYADSSIISISATGGTANYNGTGNYKMPSGIYNYTVTDANGCTAIATAIVTQPAQLTANSSVASSPCIGNTTSVSITANGGTLPYTGTGSFNQSNGTTNYTVTDANGCTVSTNATVIEQNNVLPSISISAVNGSTICAGTSLTLRASITNGGNSPIYNWKKNGQSVGSADSLSSSTFANGDVITCELISNATCASPTQVTSNSITINVISVNASIITNGSTTICAGDSVLLTASSGTGYLWSTGAVSNSIYVNAVGSYTVTVSDAGCSSTSSIMQILPGSSPAQPSAIIASNTSILKGQTGVVFSTNAISGVQYNWTYSGTGATINGIGNSITIDFSSTATNGTLSVIANNSCGSSIPQTINLTLLNTSFTDGNIVALQTYTTVSKSSSPITLKEFTKAGTTTAIVNLPATGANAIQTAGVYGGSEGFLSTSSDNRFITIAGYNTAGSFADITGTTSSTVPRVVGKITPSGSYLPIAASTTFYNLNDIRGAVSDGTNFWASGASTANIDGINYFAPGTPAALATGAVPPKGYAIRIFNGDVYYSTQKAGPGNTVSQLGIFKLGSGSPISGTVSVSQVINTGVNLPQDFSFNPTMDICYIAIGSNTAAGGIQKWTKSGTSWTLAYKLGTGATNIGAYGLIVDYSGANPVLYATTFETTGNRIIKITDTGAISSASTIVSAITGVFNKGITFAPVDVGTPTVSLSCSIDTIKEAGTTSLNIVATASSAVVGNQQVKITLAGLNVTNGDYTLTDTIITIATGTSSGYVTVTAIDDTLNEGNEMVTVQMSNPTSGILLANNSSANFIIKDNDANTAPSISMDASTTNYIDGSSAPTTSPFGLSGVVSDPTDPAATLGINFKISDLESADSNLIVSASSSNTSVVSSSGFIVSGSGSVRNLKITPMNVGYTTITVNVSDGNLSSNYIINYAASLPNPTIDTTKTFFHTGMSDGSAAIGIDANYYIAGDDELNILSVYNRKKSGLPAKVFNYTSYLALPDPSKPEVDVEAGTRSITNPNRIYWSGSMSNGKLPFDNKPNRDRFFATDITKTGDSTVFTFVGYYNFRSALLAWGDANGYNFTASAAAGVDSKSLAGFSLEGMVMGPDSTTMYLGLRAPLVPTSFRHNAVIVPIQNFETWFNNGNPTGNPTFGNPIELDLDVRGIRDITRMADGTYVIVAGSPIEDGGVNNIYKWSGYPDEAPVPVNNIVGGLLNIEGLMQGVDSLGNLSNSSIQMISDGGSLILYQDSLQAKDFGDYKLRKFRSDLVTGLDLNVCNGYKISPATTTYVCANTPTTFSAPTGSHLSYNWSNGASTASITVSAFNSYSVTISHSKLGCSSTVGPVKLERFLPSDFDDNNVTNNSDFLMLLGLFNQNCTCPEDVNADGVVNNVDFLMLLSQFNHTCQ